MLLTRTGVRFSVSQSAPVRSRHSPCTNGQASAHSISRANLLLEPISLNKSLPSCNISVPASFSASYRKFSTSATDDKKSTKTSQTTNNNRDPAEKVMDPAKSRVDVVSGSPSDPIISSGSKKHERYSKEIEKHYLSSHVPLGFYRPHEPPYTNTHELENLDLKVYNMHVAPERLADRFALSLVNFFKHFTNFFFRDKYTHHAVVLETVAAVPGMVAGMLRHFKSLRRMERDHGWITKLLEEAENERMHLLTWMQVIRPTLLERVIVMSAQVIYTPAYALLYVFSPSTAHRFVGYLEEIACHEYTLFLKAIDEGKIANVDAPAIAKSYWNLAPDATLRDVVLVVRADEAMHRDANHKWSDKHTYGLH